MLVGEEVAPEADRPGPGAERVDRRGEHHRRADRVERELEADDDAEIAAAAAQRPEEIAVFLFAGGDELAVGGDDI